MTSYCNSLASLTSCRTRHGRSASARDLTSPFSRRAYSTNFAATLKGKKMYLGIDPDDAGKYSTRGEEVCLRMGIKVSRGKTAADAISRLQIVPLTTSTGPVHDDASTKKGESIDGRTSAPEPDLSLSPLGRSRQAPARSSHATSDRQGDDAVPFEAVSARGR